MYMMEIDGRVHCVMELSITDGFSPCKSYMVTAWPLLLALTILPPTTCMNKDNIISPLIVITSTIQNNAKD